MTVAKNNLLGREVWLSLNVTSVEHVLFFFFPRFFFFFSAITTITYVVMHYMYGHLECEKSVSMSLG